MKRTPRLCPRLSAAVLLAATLAATGSAAADGADPFVVDADAYLVEVNGQPRWQRHADAPMPPASLTKLMTALLVLEDDGTDRVVTVIAAAARQRGTRIGVRAGERYRVSDLLAAALVASANDACAALAGGGNPQAFVQRMNRRAASLGLTVTHFRNACGFDAPGHVSSARELAVIARAALRFPEFAQMVALPRVAIRTEDGRHRLSATSTNALIGNYGPAVGIKTGYTANAGPCLVALGRQEGIDVLLVMLRAPNRWWDAVGLLEQGFRSARHQSTGDEGAR